MTPAVNGTSTVPEREGALAFYDLPAFPFGPGAESAWFWPGGTRAAVLAGLLAAIRLGDRLVLLTGEAGAGKTMLADRLGRMLAGEGFRVGKLTGPPLAPADLVAAAARACRIAEPCGDEAALATRLRDRPGARGSAGARGLLIVDEAQSLTSEALRQIARLSAMAPDGALSILLVGQTELHTLLSEEQHAHVRQRVTARYTVDPLPSDEVREYVEHRLRMAGAARPIFSAPAMDRIAALARGAPGMINVICARALIAGHQRRATVIDEEIVDDALSLRMPARPRAETSGAGQPDGAAAASVASTAPAHRRARRRALLRYGAPALAVIGLLAAYYSYAGWRPTGRDTAGHLVSSPPAASPRETTAPLSVQVTGTRAESPEPAFPSAPEGEVESGTAPAKPAPEPIAPPAPAARKSGTAATFREAPANDAKSAPPATAREAPARNVRVAPKQEPPAQRPGSRVPDSDADASDGSAIIDWLLNEGGTR